MNRVFRISPKRKEKLKHCYMEYGCSKEEAERYSGMVFDIPVLVDDDMSETEAWETDFEAGLSRKPVTEDDRGIVQTEGIRNIKRDVRVYASWSKGGWSRAGFWEKTEPAYEREGVPVDAADPVNMKNPWGNSYSYWSYLKRNERKIDSALIDPWDILLRDASQSIMWKSMQKLPCRIAALSGGSSMHIRLCADIEADSKDRVRRGHVFLLDVSGSMGCRLMLAQLNMVAMFNSLDIQDSVTVMTYSDDCRIMDHIIPVSDRERFFKAVSHISAIGGYGRKIPVIQMAYSVLNSMDVNGTVTLFCDAYPCAEKKQEMIQKEYLKREFDLGNRLNCMAYGSDTWADEELCEAVSAAGGRLFAILEPENIRRVLDEHLLDEGTAVYGVRIQIKDTQKKQDGKRKAFHITPGSFISETFPLEMETGATEEIEITWLNRDGTSDMEQIAVPVTELEKEYGKTADSRLYR